MNQVTLNKYFGTMKDGEQVPAEMLKILDGMSKMFNEDAFVILDTETTDKEMYEFGAIVYQHGKAYYVHKYVETDEDLNVAVKRIKTQIKNKKIANAQSFQGLFDFVKTKSNAKVISKDEFNKLMDDYGDMAKFAYNASFDYGKIKFKGSNISTEKVYDAMWMAVSCFPEIMGEDISHYKNLGDRGSFGKFNLEKYYTAIYRKLSASERRNLGFLYDPAHKETHKALEDVAFMTIPVLNYIFLAVKQKANEFSDKKYDIHNFAGMVMCLNDIKQKKKLESQGFKVTYVNSKKPGQIVPMAGARGETPNNSYYSFKPKNLDNSVDNITSFISTLPDEIRSGATTQQAIARLSKGKTESQKAAIQTITKHLGSGQNNSTIKLLEKMDQQLKACPNVRKVYYKQDLDAHVGTGVRIYIVPNDNVFLRGIKGDMNKLPNFIIPLADSKQMMSHYGQRGYNQWKIDINEGEVAAFTVEQLQIRAVITEVNKWLGLNLSKALSDPRQYNKISKMLQNQVYNAQESVQVAGSFVTDDAHQEAFKTRTGTASELQARLRRSMADFTPLLNAFMKEDSLVASYLSDKGLKSTSVNRSKAESEIQADLTEILLMYGSHVNSMNTITNAIKHNPRYSYLVNSHAWKARLEKQLQVAAKVGLNAGLSGETSFDTKVYATMSTEVFDALGALIPKDKRHPAQVAMTKDFSDHAKAIRKQNTRTMRFYSAEELEDSTVAELLSNDSNKMYSFGLIKANMINEAYIEFKKQMKAQGMSEQKFEQQYGYLKHLGVQDSGAFYALGSSAETALESITPKSAHVSGTEMNRKLDHMNPNWRSLPQKDIDAMTIKAFKQLCHIPHNIKITNLNMDRVLLNADNSYDGVIYGYYTEINKMVSGTKLGSTSDGDRFTAQGLPRQYFNILLAKAGYSEKERDSIDFIKEMPSSFSTEQTGGLIRACLFQIIDTINNKSTTGLNKKIGQLADTPLLKGLIDTRADYLNSGVIVFKPGATSELTHRLATYKGNWDKLYEEINTLAKNAGLLPFFEKVTNMSGTSTNKSYYKLTNKFIGLSKFGMIDVAEHYNNTPKADQRMRDAWMRDLGSVEAVTGQSMAALREFGKKKLNASAAAQATWKSLMADSERAVKRSAESALTSYKPGKNSKTVSIGFGPTKQYDIDLSKFDVDELLDLSDAMVDGFIDEKKFGKTLYGLIEQKRREKAGKGRPEDVEVYIDLAEFPTILQAPNGEPGKKIGVQHLYVSDFMLMNRNRRNSPEGTVTIADFGRDYGQVIRNLYSLKYGIGDRKTNLFNLQSSAQAALFNAYDDSHHTKGAGYEYGNSTRLFHAFFAKAAATNSKVPSITHDKEFSKGLTKEQLTALRNVGMYDQLISVEDMRAQVAHRAAGETLKDHSELLIEEAKRIFEGEGDTWQQALLKFLDRQEASEIERIKKKVNKKYRDYIEQKVKEYKLAHGDEIAALKSSEARNKFIRDYANSEVTKLVNEEYLQFKNKVLNDIIHLAEAGNIRGFSKERQKAINGVLADFVTAAVTLDSNVYQNRKHKERGLESLFSRFPYSNGRDVKFTQVYASSGVKRWHIVVGAGTAYEVNLDYDGDMPPIWLLMLDASASEYKELSGAVQTAIKHERRATSLVHLVKSNETNGKEVQFADGSTRTFYGLVSSDQDQDLADFQAQMIAAVAGKGLKGKTGNFSNIYQSVTNAMMDIGMDEASAGNSHGKTYLISALLARSFFEKLTQDAISSKKVYNRLRKKLGSSASIEDIAFACINETTDLLLMLRDSANYDLGGEGLTKILNKANEMGLFDPKADRISAQLYGYVNDLVDENDQNSLNNFKHVFGVDYKDVKITFDENDIPKTIGGIDFNSTEGQKRFKDMCARLNGFTPVTGTDGSIHYEFNMGDNAWFKALDAVNYKFTTTPREDGKTYNMGQVIKNYSGDLDTRYASLNSLGMDTRSFMYQATATVKKALNELERMENEDNKKSKKSPVLYDPKKHKFYITDINDFLNGKGDAFGIVPVKTTHDASHIIHINHNDTYGKYSKLENAVDFRYSVTQLIGALHQGGHGNGTDATDYGSVHHGFIEYFFNNEARRKGDWAFTDNFTGVTQQDLVQWIEMIRYSKDPKDRDVVNGLLRYFIQTDGNISMDRVNNLLATVNSFLLQAKKAGVNDTTLVEQSCGMVVNINGHKVLIGGTIDELWRIANDNQYLDVIGDAKTSKYPYLNYVLQLSLYNAIRRGMLANNGDSAISASDKMYLFWTPRDHDKYPGSTINIEAMSDGELAQFIADAVNVLRETNLDTKAKKIELLMYKWNPQLRSHMYIEDSIGNRYGIDTSTGLSWNDIITMMDHNFPMDSIELSLRDKYEQSDKSMNFYDWVRTQLSGQAFTDFANYSKARGAYLYEYIQSLSAKDQKDFNDHLADHYQELARKNLTMAEQYVLFKDQLESEKSFDFKGFAENRAANTVLVEQLKTKEEADRENMENAKLDEAIKALNALAAVLSGSQGSASSGQVGSVSTPKVQKNEITAGNFAAQFLAGQDFFNKMNSTQDAGLRKIYEDNAVGALNLMFGEQHSADLTLDTVFGENGIFKDGFVFKGLEKFLTAGDASILSGLLGDKAHLKENQKIIAGGISGDGGTYNSDAINKKNALVSAVEEDTNKIIKERVALYKELYKLQSQINTAKQKGNTEEQEELELLMKEKSATTNMSMEELSAYLSPGELAVFQRGVDEKGDKEVNSYYKNKRMSYESLLKQRESLVKQQYDNDLTYKTTYDKNYRISLDEQRAVYQEQQQQVEEQIKEMEDEFNKSGNQQLIDMMGSAQNASQMRMMQNITNVDVKHKGQDTLWGQLGTQFGNTLTRFTQMGAAYKIIGQIRNGFNQVISSAKELDKSMTDLRIITGKNRAEANATMQTYAGLASQLGATTTEVASAGNAWLRQGYQVNEITELITASTYLSKLGMIDMTTATTDLTSALHGFGLEASDAMDVVDKLTALDVKAATTAGDIAEGLSQFANLATLNGVSIDEASAMVATIADVTQQSGSSVGNALKTVMSRYSNVKSGSFSSMGESDESADGSVNDVETVLKKVGVNVRTSTYEFRDFSDVLADVAEKWDTLDSVSQNAIAAALGGVRQRESVLVLLNQYEKYSELLEVSENSEGTAQKKYLSYQEQLEAQTKKLQAAWESIAQDASINEFLTTITKVTTWMVEKLPVVLKYTGRLLATFNAYKLPSMFSGLGNFLGIGNLKSPGSGLINKNETGLNKFKNSAINQRMSNYGDERSSGMGLTKTNNILGNIKTQVDTIVKKYTNPNGDQKPNATNVPKDTNSGNNGNNTGETPTDGAQETNDNVSNAAVKGQTNSKGSTVASVATVVTGTLTNVLTAGSSHKSLATGETVESSEEAKAASKVATGLGSGILGTIGAIYGGPMGAALGTSIGGSIGEGIGYLLGQWIDEDRDARNARVEEANENLTLLSEINDSVSNIEKYSSESVQDYESYQEMMEAIDDLKETLLNNSDITLTLVQAVQGQTINGITIEGIDDLYKLIDSYADADSETRLWIENLLKVATAKTTTQETLQSKENELYEANKELESYKNTGIMSGMYVTTTDGNGHSYTSYHNYSSGEKQQKLQEWAAANNINLGESSENNWLAGTTTLSYTLEAGNNDQLGDILEQYLLFLAEIGDESTYNELTDQLNNYKATMSELKQIYKDINEQKVETALLEAKIVNSTGQELSLLSANLSQLKKIGKEEIWNTIAKQLEESGGLYGYSIYSAEGKSIIDAVIKSNEKLYSVFTGQAYTLTEALGSNDFDLLTSFATALGVSLEKLASLESKYGNLKLSQIYATPSETRESVSELESLFTSLASSSGLTAENLEKILSTYPELIPYMNDSVELGSQLLNRIEALNSLYAEQLLDDLLGNETYFQYFKDSLTKGTLGKFDDAFGGAESADQILELLAMGPEKAAELYGLTAEEYAEIKNKFDKLYDLTVDDVYGTEIYDTYLDYVQRKLDAEIENLNEQKSALENINEQRKYEVELIEAKQKLENAQKEKKRIYREGVGWVYETDQAAISEAADNLEKLTNQKKISELEQQISELEEMKEQASNIPTEKELENLQTAFESFFGSNTDLLNNASSIIQQLSQLYKGNSVTLDASSKVGNFEEARDSAYNSIFGDVYTGSWLDANGNFNAESGYEVGKSGSLWQDVQYTKAAMDYAATVYGKDSDQYKAAENAYNTAIDSYTSSVKSFGSNYDTTGDYLKNGMSDAQSDYYTNSENRKSNEAFTSFKVQTGDDVVKYRSGSGPLMPGDARFDAIEDLAQNSGKGGSKLAYWRPGYELTETNDIVSSTNKHVLSADTFNGEPYNGSLLNWAEKQPAGTVFSNDNMTNFGVILGESSGGRGIYELDPVTAAARGSLGLHGGSTLINELGTEAIVTPDGTITALPSGTGVVPADITRSLWQLGELSPMIANSLLGGASKDNIGSRSYVNSTDESLNINSLIMNVSADNNFDVDAFANALRSRIALSKNNRR